MTQIFLSTAKRRTMLYDGLIPQLLEKKTTQTVQRCVLFLRIPTDILFSAKEQASLFFLYLCQTSRIHRILENHTNEFFDTLPVLLPSFPIQKQHWK